MGPGGVRKDGPVASPPDHAGGPIGFAHRGARAECRDNTLASFLRALQLGARAIESDAWVTADGIVILDHDGVVRRGLRRYPIRGVARADLPPHIPALADLVEVCGDNVDISLDVRDPATAEPTIAVVERAGRAGHTWLCGRVSDLEVWRRRSADVRLVNSARLSDMREGLARRVDRLAAAGVDAVNLRWPEWNAARVDIVHGAGLLAFAWDAQSSRSLAGLVGLGVDGVYSDHVALMVRELAAAREAGP